MADEAMSEASDGARAPFALICTEWGVDIDAPDQEFFLGSPALAPHANHVLVSVRCLTCEADHDVALWTVDQRRFISEAGSGMVEAAADADVLALVERYHALVAACRREADTQSESAEGPVELDLSTMDVTIETDRFAALPMAALAAARGLRLAVAARPGVRPPAALLLGPYRCIGSFDRTPERPYPYALHVSVGNDALPGTLPKLELHWLLSLFVIPGEMPFVEAEPGQTVQVIHYYLPAYSAELNPC